MTAPTTLAQRLLAANADLGWVEKAGKNKEQGYNYVQAVDILADVRDVLNKHGVVFSFSTTKQTVTPVTKPDGKFTWLTELQGDYAYTNADDKNDVQSGYWAGSATDTSDKGTWKAITGALKYVLLTNHLLPTGDDPEADSGDDEKKPAEKKASAPLPPTQRDTTKAEKSEATGLSDKQRALLMASLRDRGVTIKEAQQYILNKACGKHSTKQMDSTDLDKVLEAIKDDDLVVEAMASVSK